MGTQAQLGADLGYIQNALVPTANYYAGMYFYYVGWAGYFAAVRYWPGYHAYMGAAQAYLGAFRTVVYVWIPAWNNVVRQLQSQLAQLNGAARDALGFVGSQIEIELNAAQSNPLVLVDEGRLISVGNFEIQPLATALDLCSRTAL